MTITRKISKSWRQLVTYGHMRCMCGIVFQTGSRPAVMMMSGAMGWAVEDGGATAPMEGKLAMMVA